jgi:hypothetical protein
MTDVPDSFTAYLAAWNERDVERIAPLVESALSEDAVFADPANHRVGRADIAAMITEAREGDFAEADYVLTSGIDGHNRRYRYRWEVRVGGETLLPGMDVTTVDDAGLIERIDGFFGDFPEV